MAEGDASQGFFDLVAALAERRLGAKCRCDEFCVGSGEWQHERFLLRAPPVQGSLRIDMKLRNYPGKHSFWIAANGRTHVVCPAVPILSSIDVLHETGEVDLYWGSPPGPMAVECFYKTRP